jgi:hypothetical protein
MVRKTAWQFLMESTRMQSLLINHIGRFVLIFFSCLENAVKPSTLMTGRLAWRKIPRYGNFCFKGGANLVIASEAQDLNRRAAHEAHLINCE